MYYAVATLIGKETWQGILDQNPATSEMILAHRGESDFIHFSWMVSQAINLETVSATLQSIAETTMEFECMNGGIGVFSGEFPVVTFVLARNKKLAATQLKIWNNCYPNMGMVNVKYSPDAWIPHITLLHYDIEKEDYCSFIEKSISTNIQFRIMVDNLAIIFKDGNKAGLLTRYDLKKKETAR
jgi:2'-5' RNA ligase